MTRNPFELIIAHRKIIAVHPVKYRFMMELSISEGLICICLMGSFLSSIEAGDVTEDMRFGGRIPLICPSK